MSDDGSERRANVEVAQSGRAAVCTFGFTKTGTARYEFESHTLHQRGREQIIRLPSVK